MSVDHHCQETLGWDDSFSAPNRPPEHRTVIDEGTVLLQAVATEARADEWLKPLPLPASQDNTPDMLVLFSPGSLSGPLSVSGGRVYHVSFSPSRPAFVLGGSALCAIVLCWPTNSGTGEGLISG